MAPHIIKTSLLCGALALGGLALSFTPDTVRADAAVADNISLSDVLYEAAARARIERKGFEVEGRKLRVLECNRLHLTLRDDRRAEEFHYEWNALPAEWQAKLLEEGRRDDAANLFIVAQTALDEDREILARRLLAKAVEDKPELAADAKSLIGEEFEVADELLIPAGYDAEALEEALDELEDAPGRAGDELGERELEEFEAALKTLAEMDDFARRMGVEKLEALRRAELAEAEECTGFKRDIEELVELKQQLDHARELALDVIFDERQWPYPYGPQNEAVTRQVMDLVNDVREIWESNESLRGSKTRHPEAAFDRIALFEDAMETLEPEGTWQRLDETYLGYLRAITNTELSLKNFAASKEEMQRISWNREVREYNAKIAEKYEREDTAPDSGAWAQLEVTNDYREMMGRHALKMNFKLYWAARHHSDYCISHNGRQIAHVIQGEPRGETPGQRMRHEGYNGLGGENICFITGNTPMKAHQGWLESSGHHRNILNARWRVMGNGRCGAIWTQLFGDHDEGDQNTQSKGGK